LAHTVTADDITWVRGDVRARAQACGLSGVRLSDFLVAVNEILTNAVLHAGGVARLRMFTEPGSVVCEIVDHGPGIPPARLTDLHLPDTLTIGGRGLWLARAFSDEMTVDTDAKGTTVRLRAYLRPPQGAAGPNHG
jgi:anti-sigma regulatory factor (Ser/Thr protein kinase)